MTMYIRHGAKVERTSRGKGLTVYKVLSYNGEQFVSPYQGMVYNRGDLKTTENFTFQGYVNKIIPFTQNLPELLHPAFAYVKAGLHTYASIREAVKHARLGVKYIVVECRIPRRSLYIRSNVTSEHIVSLKLRVGKAVAGDRDAVDKFNSKAIKNLVTSQKLYKLAAALKTQTEQFSLINGRHCVVGIGNCLNLRAGHIEPVDDYTLTNVHRFAQKFGISIEEGNNIWVGYWGNLGIAMANQLSWTYGTSGALEAAKAIKLLADKYKATGN